MNIRNNLSQLINKRILLITEVVFGSGDFFAAKKLITQLLNDGEGISIDWMIYTPRGREKEIADKIIDFKNSTISSSLTIGIILKNSIISKSNFNISQHIDLILFYPTMHYMSPIDFQYLKNLNVPMVQVKEYDGMKLLHHMPNKAEIVCLSSGFNGLGLFLDDYQQQYPDKLNNAPLNLDQTGRELFLSYLSSEHTSVVNDVNFIKYFQIVLKISSAAKSIDIITNTNPLSKEEEIIEYAWEHGFSTVTYLKNDKNQLQVKKSWMSPSEIIDERELRIIDPYPLRPEQVKSLMMIAHPLQNLTGDQSLSEAISFSSLSKNIFPFYQMMYWKVDMFENWLRLATSCLGNKSKYVELLAFMQKKAVIDINKFVDLWVKNNEIIYRAAYS